MPFDRGRHPLGRRALKNRSNASLGEALSEKERIMEKLLGKKIIGTWNAYEVLWLAVFCIMAVYITLSTGDTFFGFTVFLSGVLCVLMAAKGNPITFVFGAYNVLGYAWLAFQAGLYGEMALNLLFFTPMNVVGFVLWRKKMEDPGTVSMRRLTAKQTALVGVAAAAGIAALGFGLSQILGQASPYLDATTNVLSVTATLLMNARFREQWLCYIVLDGFTVLMWVLRLMAGTPDSLIMVLMWAAYLVNAFYGMYKWSKGSKAEKGA